MRLVRVFSVVSPPDDMIEGKRRWTRWSVEGVRRWTRWSIEVKVEIAMQLDKKNEQKVE